MRREGGSWRIALLLVLIPGFCWADTLDRALIDRGQKLAQACVDNGYRTVGVLRFAVQLGKQPARLDVEPLSSNLATRVENLLIMVAEDSEKLRIIRDAGPAAANRDHRAGMQTAQARKKLFDYSYSLAWGKERVKADAFLTGSVKLEEKLTRATVRIDAFDVRDTRKTLLSFTIAVDRSLLADVGLSFRVADKDIAHLKPYEADRQAIASALGKRVWANEPLDVRIEVDGSTTSPTLSSQLSDWVVTAPIDSSLRLRIRNKSKHTIGYVIKMAGRSLYREEVEEPERSMAFLLASGKEDSSDPGYYVDDRDGKRRFTLIPRTLTRSGLGELSPDRERRVDLFVLVKQPHVNGDPLMSLRGLRPGQLRDTVWTRSALVVALTRSANLSLKKDAKRSTDFPDLAPAEPEKRKEHTAGRMLLVEYRRIRLVERKGEK